MGHHGGVGGPPAPPARLPLPPGHGRPPPRGGQAPEAAVLLHRPHHHGHQLKVTALEIMFTIKETSI